IARRSALQHASVQVLDAQAQAFRRQFAAQMSNPLTAANLGIVSFRRCGSQHAVGAPIRWDSAQGEEIIFSFDRFQFCQQRKIRTEASKCFNKTRDFLAGGIKDPVIAFGIIEAIAERYYRVLYASSQEVSCFIE